MDTALPEGSLFANRYRVDHLIGEGPRKQTYRAWDLKAHRRVALAVMLPGADPLATHREVEMLGKVCPHPRGIEFVNSEDGCYPLHGAHGVSLTQDRRARRFARVEREMRYGARDA
jgi:hypothetical protein